MTPSQEYPKHVWVDGVRFEVRDAAHEAALCAKPTLEPKTEPAPDATPVLKSRKKEK